jgi:hypothetical protein
VGSFSGKTTNIIEEIIPTTISCNNYLILTKLLSLGTA